MAKYLPLPDGSSLKVADDMSYDEAMAKARVKFPTLFQSATAAPKEGLMADVMGAGSNLLNIGRTGIAALTGDTTQAAEAGVARQAELQKKYKSGFDPEKIVDKFNQGEYLGAAGEALSQVPSAVAGLLPSVGQTFGSAAVGRVGGGALGALVPIPGGAAIGAQVGQYAVPFLVNAIQALGGQAQEKVQTQKEAGEKPDVSALELAPYAAGNAALNLIGTKIAMPSAFKSAIGKKVAEETADAAAAAARKELIDEARKVAGRGTFETILRGTGGFTLGELPTEILQDVVDRAAVGKPLADDDAFKSYRATALNTVLASPLGGGLGVQQRMGARSTVAQEDRQVAARNAAEAAATAEAAKTSPEALTQLDQQYQDAVRRRAELQSAIAKKPTKASTPEEKQAYAQAAQELTRFQKEEFAPINAEYSKRKGAISAMQAAQLAAIEQQAATGQPTAAATTPNAEPSVPLPRLLERFDALRGDLSTVEDRLAAGPSIEEQAALSQQRQLLTKQTQDYGKLIESRGGVAMTADEHTQAVKEADAAIASADTARKKLLTDGAFDEADKQAAKIAELMQARNALASKRAPIQAYEAYKESTPGDTQKMFAEEELPAPAEQKPLAYVNPEGKEITPPAPAPETVTPTPDTALQAANEELATAVKSKDQAAVSDALGKINEAETARARAAAPKAETKEGKLDTSIWDIFSPHNVIATAIRNNDSRTLATLARVEDRKKLDAMETRYQEEQRLQKMLDERLGLGGEGISEKTGEPLKSVKLERANLFDDLYDQKAKSLFANGNSQEYVLDAEGNKTPLQDIYDKQGVAAVELAVVMEKIRALRKKVEMPQGNAKTSLYQKLTDLAAEHETLLEQKGVGLASKTMGEKVATVQAKLGKGEAPAAREMDASEKYQLERRIKAVEAQYNAALGQVAPLRKQIDTLYSSLYKQTPLETVEKEREAKKTLLLPAGNKRSMSRTARTQARIASGNVRKEAETSSTMRDLALKLGQQTPEYEKLAAAQAKRLAALKAKYGNADMQVAAFRESSYADMQEKAMALGKATPEYKATLKEQIEIVREALAGSKQTLKSKRGTQTTRKVSGAKKEEATGSPESRATGDKRHAGKAMSVAEQERLIKEINDDEGIELSRGVPAQGGQTVASLEKALDKAVGDKGIAGKRIKLFQSVSDLFADPAYMYDYKGANIPSDAKAFVNPKNGQAFMFADNIAKGEALGVLLHEIGVHIGFRNLFNAAQYARLITAVKSWAKRNDNSIEARIAKRAIERVEAAETTAEQYDDELLAYTVEEAVKAGVNPDVLQGGGPIRSWLKAVLDVLRNALSKFGINPKTLTTGDLVNMAYGAAQLELRGTWHGSDAAFTAFDSNLSGAGEGAYDVRFEGSTNLGKGPYTTPNKEYAEYYQHDVPFGKAANESGYGNKTYQDYRSLDEKYMATGSEDLSLAMLQSKYESSLLSRYLSDVSSGGELDPVKNTEAQKYVSTIQAYADSTLQGFEKALANKIKRGGSADSVKQAEASVAYAQRLIKAVAGLDASKIKGLTQRPDKGNLYRTLDDIPRAQVFGVNEKHTLGERPKLDALMRKYAYDSTQNMADKIGWWSGNGLFYKMRDTLGIDKTTALLKAAGIDAIEQENEGGKYVERAYIDQAPEILGVNLKPIGPATGKGRAGAGSLLFSRTANKKGEFDAEQEPSTIDKILGNVLGLAGRMQLVDKFAALSQAFKAGMNKGVLTDTEAGNAEYLLRFGEHRSQLAGQALTNGPLSLVTTKTDKGIEHTYQSTKGANAMQMAEALNKGGFANDSEAEGLLTIITSGERAKQVGWSKLNYSDPAAAKTKYERALAHLDANPKQKEAIKEAMALYQKINAGQMDFLVQVGELTATKAAELKAITYVPFYRVNANGEVQLMIDKERPVRIGNIKDEPQLQQLVGDNKQIMPIFASMVQNTFMLTNLGLRNQSVKETAFMLRKVGIASRIANGPGPAGPSTVRFKKNGVDMHVVIDTDMYGIPAKYIVEGMEGIKTTIPAVVKLLGIPADITRKFVTRSPTYVVRQMIRDPLNAWLTTGTDAIPVLSSFKELGAMVAKRSETERTLMESGAVSSNVFTGDERDMSKILREITSGRAGWTKRLAQIDAFALQADTATRATIYKDSIAKGMSHQQALLRSVESMNFSRRGLSPSIQMLSTMIPFFNAQIQGLDVLYRAFKGDMTHSEQLQIREKLFKRGLLLAAGTMAYAAAMQDDEAYKRAKPEERYGNWFVYIPGFSEPVRVPIPFELGYLFKALPEAVYNLAAGDEKAGDAVKGIGKLLGQSNPFALPQAIKPLTEVVLGKSFFSGDIESEREKQTLAKDRYRENSTEVAKLIGSVTGEAGISPIKIDYLIRGYTGGLGIALVQLANPLLNTEATTVEKPSTKPSKLPFIGGLFQPVEGRGTLDSAYDKMQEIQQVKGSYNKLVEQGKRAEAAAFVQEYANQLALVSTSGSVQKALGEMAKQERFIRSSPTMTAAQKDAALERLDKMEVAYARQFLTLADRTTPR